MIRTEKAGVHYGTLAKVQDGDGAGYDVKLTGATRVYYWEGACSLSQLSVDGSTNKNCKLSINVPSIFLKAIEVIEMTQVAYDNLSSIPKWKI